MNRAERRRQERELRSQARRMDASKAPGSAWQSLGDFVGAGGEWGDWIVQTSPGCSRPEHREEVLGAGMALSIRGPWSGDTLMDCGCTLRVVQMSELLEVVEDEFDPGDTVDDFGSQPWEECACSISEGDGLHRLELYAFARGRCLDAGVHDEMLREVELHTVQGRALLDGDRINGRCGCQFFIDVPGLVRQ